MIVLLSVVFILLLLNGAFMMLSLNEPPKKNNKALKNLKEKTTMTEAISKNLVLPLANIIKPYIKIAEKDEALLLQKLERANIKEDVKLYYAKAFASSMLTIPLVFVFFILQNKLFVFLSIALAIAILFRGLDRYKVILDKKTEDIQKVIPSFIRSILYKVTSDDKTDKVKANLVEIFESYLAICPKAFYYDISLLIYDLKTRDSETALQNFNKRVGIIEVTFLVNALIGLTRGEKQTEVLKDLAREMSIKNRQIIQKELEERPGKVFKACIPLFVIAFITIGYVLVSALADGFSTLM